MSKNRDKKLSIIPLGGVGEIGKNMTVIEYDGELLIIDAGLAFPEEEMLGIDFVIPDITYLKENKDRIRGLILTHRHEDHIGALPYVLREIDSVIYGTKLTLGLVEGKLREHKLLSEVSLRCVQAGDRVNIGPVSYTHLVYYPLRRGW